MPALTEKQFMAQVLQLAKLAKWRVFHTHDSRRSQAGFPDLVLVKGKKLLFLELKSEQGKVSKAQMDWINDLIAAGQVALWVRPSNWKAIQEALLEEGGVP